MADQTHARRLNVLAEGKHHRPYLQLGDEKLRISEAAPRQGFGYSQYHSPFEPEEGVIATASPCPCASTVIA